MRTLASAALLSLTACTAVAGPADYVHTPVVERGERELDLKFGRARERDGGSAAGGALGFEYGVTERWGAEIVAQWAREAGAGSRFDGWEIENRFQLTETGRLPLEAGLLLEIERPEDRDQGYELTVGPMLQTQWRAVQANLNLLLQRRLRADETSRTEFVYRWQLRRRVRPLLDWGAQGFGELGRWNDWAPRSGQSHQLGPALFGTLRMGDDEAIDYNVALLFGSGGAAPRHTLRMQAAFAF